MKKRSSKFDTKNESAEVSKSLGVKKRMTVHDVRTFSPKTERQRDFLEMFFQDVPVISLHGFPGTGKTFIALAAAIKDVLDPSTPYKKITIVRSAVEVRGIGFLPGTAEEKLAQYETPYIEIFKDILNFNDPYEMAKQLGIVEFRPTTFLRGTTFDDQIVIVDEVENMDFAEIETVFTRIGINTKMVFCGDDAQSDLQRQRQKSGFADFREILLRMNPSDIGMVEFGLDDIVRSKLIADYLKAKFFKN